MLILFVCTANICRSPMAEALFNRRLRKANPRASYQVASAGTWTRAGDPADRKAQQVLTELGLDLSQHRSQPVSRTLLQRASLILVMTQSQREALCVEFSECADQIFLLSEMAGQTYDIPDPINGTLADFRETAHQLDLLLATGFGTILRYAAAGQQVELLLNAAEKC